MRDRGFIGISRILWNKGSSVKCIGIVQSDTEGKLKSRGVTGVSEDIWGLKGWVCSLGIIGISCDIWSFEG